MKKQRIADKMQKTADQMHDALVEIPGIGGGDRQEVRRGHAPR